MFYRLPSYRLVLSAVSALLMAVTSAPAAEDAPLWTQHPTRIDRSAQTYERLPALKVAHDSRTWLVVAPRIKVLDSTSFAIGTQQYRLVGIKAIAPKRYCQSIEGGRWPCGRMASIFLGNLVRAQRLLCDIGPAGKTVLLSHCVIKSRDVAQAIIINGYGMAEADDRLLTVQAGAQQAAKLGLWRNPRCVDDFDHC